MSLSAFPGQPRKPQSKKRLAFRLRQIADKAVRRNFPAGESLSPPCLSRRAIKKFLRPYPAAEKFAPFFQCPKAGYSPLRCLPNRLDADAKTRANRQGADERAAGRIKLPAAVVGGGACRPCKPKGRAIQVISQEERKKIPPRVNGKFLLPRFSFSQKNARPTRQSVYARTPTQKRTPTDRRRASTQSQESSFPRQPDTQRLRK